MKTKKPEGNVLMISKRGRESWDQEGVLLQGSPKLEVFCVKDSFGLIEVLGFDGLEGRVGFMVVRILEDQTLC